MRNGRSQITFIGLFAAIYAVFHYLYFLIPNEVLTTLLYRWAITEPAAWVINMIAQGELVSAEYHKLISNNVILEIVRGCDGSGVFFLISAAILAFRAGWQRTLSGLLLALLLVYALNQLRVIGLFFILIHQPEWFTPLHTFYIPSLLIVIAGLFYLNWLNWAVGHARTPIPTG